MKLHDSKIFKVVKCVLNKTLIVCLLVAGSLAPTVSNAYSPSTAQQLNSKPYVSAQLSEPEKYGTITLVKTGQENLRIDNKFMYKPQRVGDRTVLAVKDVSDNLGLNLSWSEADQIATVKKDNTEVAIPLNRKVIAVNDVVKSIDTVAVVDKALNRT
ncbi:MAG: stalk domain-containing protein [Filifactoraceae bacterium]